MISEMRVKKTGRVERTVVRILQVLMLIIFALGIYYGNSGVFVNAGVGLLVTLLPGVLERRYDFTMNVGIVL
mgnify:CR=1 FL=1